MEAVGAQAYRDQLRAMGRDAGRKDVAFQLNPADGVPCGKGGCMNVARHAILLQPRPGLDQDTSLTGCDDHAAAMWEKRAELGPPLPPLEIG